MGRRLTATEVTLTRTRTRTRTQTRTLTLTLTLTSINFIASCPHGLLGKAAAHVVALARAGKIIDNSYHCFNREFTTGLRAHKKAIVAAQASSRPKPTHLATAPSSYCAHVGRSHLSRTRLADRRELQRQEDRAQDHEQ